MCTFYSGPCSNCGQGCHRCKPCGVDRWCRVRHGCIRRHRWVADTGHQKEIFPIAGFVRKCSSNQTLEGSYSECGRIRATSNKNIEGPESTKLIRILNRPVVLTLRVNLIHRGELRVSSVHRPCHVIAIYTGMVARKESRIIWRGRTILDIAGEAKIRLSVKDRNSFLLATPLAFEVETPQRTCSANRLFQEATWELARN
jgi:hypothetical protein